MPAPKKAPARARKAAPRTVKTARDQQIAAFEAFRARARSVDLPPVSTPDQVVIGPEHGFDPPLTATWPTSLMAKSALDIATRTLDIGGILYLLLGPQQVLRAAEKFSQADPAEAERLMAGLAIFILEQTLGPGAGDVEGGMRASST